MIAEVIEMIQESMDKEKEIMQEFEEYAETDNGEKELD